MPIKHVVGALSTLGLLSLSTLAQAGSCAGENCQLPVQYLGGPSPVFDSMTVANVNPMGYLRSIDFQHAPHVSIMRIHSLGPTANLSDAPIAFTEGCHAQSTAYCRQTANKVSTPQPQPAPIIAPPPITQPQPIIPRPIPPMVVPPVKCHRPMLNSPCGILPAPRPPHYGQGFDPSKFIPRQYGDPTFVPGIAHVPTSYVDRDPLNADRALNSGRAIPQPIANGGVAPRPYMMSHPYNPHPVTGGGPNIVMATPHTQQRSRTYMGTVNSDGTYWEKVSGPTMIGNAMATQVICKRQMPNTTMNMPAPSHCSPQHVATLTPHPMGGWGH